MIRFCRNGSAQLAGAAPGLQIRCGALKPSRVGSIPMHFRHNHFKSLKVYNKNFPKLPCGSLNYITLCPINSRFLEEHVNNNGETYLNGRLFKYNNIGLNA